MVPKNAISHVGVFLLNDSGLCAISMCKSRCEHHPLCKEKGCSYIYLIVSAKMKVKLCILYERSVLHAKLSYMLNERGKTISLLK